MNNKAQISELFFLPFFFLGSFSFLRFFFVNRKPLLLKEFHQRKKVHLGQQIQTIVAEKIRQYAAHFWRHFSETSIANILRAMGNISLRRLFLFLRFFLYPQIDCDHCHISQSGSTGRYYHRQLLWDIVLHYWQKWR